MSDVVVSGDFEVHRFIGRGCYSIVYQVQKNTGSDCGARYALKRFFLENDSSVKCVLRERHILERLASVDYQSPFLPMLFYAMWCNYSSAFVLREGVGCDLYDLLCHVGYLSEANARFYLSEIICGLEHLHSLNIVHLDIKPENVLLYTDGHVFVSDLDRSFDASRNIKPTLDDFTGTPLFMAPEIARGEVIDVRADVWSLGALVAEMVSGPIRSEAATTAQDFQRARTGSYNIRGFKSFSKSLQSFFTACLQRHCNQRPYLKDVKKLRFLKFVDWEKANALLLHPPYNTADIHHRPSKDDRGAIGSTDQRVISGAFSPIKPAVLTSTHKKVKNSDCVETTDRADASILSEALIRDGYSLARLDAEFNSFNFIHPCLRAAKRLEEIVENPEQSSLNSKLDGKEIVDIESIFTDDVKKVQQVCPSSPSLFGRSRRRGLSIGD